MCVCPRTRTLDPTTPNSKTPHNRKPPAIHRLPPSAPARPLTHPICHARTSHHPWPLRLIPRHPPQQHHPLDRGSARTPDTRPNPIRGAREPHSCPQSGTNPHWARYQASLRIQMARRWLPCAREKHIRSPTNTQPAWEPSYPTSSEDHRSHATRRAGEFDLRGKKEWEIFKKVCLKWVKENKVVDPYGRWEDAKKVSYLKTLLKNALDVEMRITLGNGLRDDNERDWAGLLLLAEDALRTNTKKVSNGREPTKRRRESSSQSEVEETEHGNSGLRSKVTYDGRQSTALPVNHNR